LGGFVTAEDVFAAAKGFLALLEHPPAPEERESALTLALDRLALASHSVRGPFDDAEYPDPPEPEPANLRARVEALYPELGWYNEAEEIAGSPEQSGLVVGDAINDIVDIARDVQEFVTRWHSTSKGDALWHFRFGFESHWGKHLRSLQLYLHARSFYPSPPNP
jgi:hypothetical protein